VARSDFSRRLIDWHQQHGRHDLPWQNTRDPYRVWLSEIMLQQTQVAAVIPYYARFLDRFPTLADLANAPVEDVMGLWSGLGYYARARNLHACARTVQTQNGGKFPPHPDAIAELPGIGRSTANAIAAFCFDAPVPILDGNVKRVLARCFGVDGFPGAPAVEKRLWALAEQQLPARDIATYIQAQMDLGATVCKRGKPLCEVCPLQNICVARRDGRVAELPTARAKRAVPERAITVLALLRGNEVLLEQRPPTGIWGGLLSLPELPAGVSADTFAENRLACSTRGWEQLPSVIHALTHFRLTITPIMTKATPLLRAAEPGLCWVSLQRLAEAPLPAPIRRILAAIDTVVERR
jgi:A/G-specific adenine glycosylase